jgi:DNA gyrase subunit A
MTTTTASVIPINIEDELRQSYMDYAMSVIIGRALPDVRDGLKPVHRRILYAMHELGNRWNQSYKKSARVVGDVIGKYHPHGDIAVYDALVRLAQEFNMSLPLVDGQGNFGSIDGDPAAAMRYTEVRMARPASDLLSDIEKDTVPWGPNYDDSLLEPLVLPARLPNLLVNGAEGIAVGMATKIPPHNLGEVVDGLIALIEDPSLSSRQLMEYIKGPDFPTRGTICGRRGIVEAYEDGRGIITLRARAEVEEIRKDRLAIIVTELPFQVNKARLLEKIALLVREKRLEDISDLRDESDRHGIRMVIELKHGAVPEVVLNNLYKMTAMQQSFGIIMLAIVAGQPRVMGLREILGHFVDFRREVVTRRTRYELGKAREREHILEGLVIALDHIDEVIRVIRASRTVEDARGQLMASFGLSAVQSQAILDMRLQKLTGLERDKVLEELQEVRARIAELQEILVSEKRLMEVIVEELREVRAQHAVPRRTELGEAVGDFEDLELIAEEEMVVTVTHRGYIKRTSLDEYRQQRRGGRGSRGIKTRDEDFVQSIFSASTHDTFLVFTTLGRVFKLGVYEIPLAGRSAQGRALVNLLPFEPDEKMAEIVSIREFSEDRYLMFATRKGLVKRTELSAYKNLHSGGLRAVKLVEGDDLISVRVVEEEQRVLLVTAGGQSICFAVKKARPMGRVSQGVKGITLSSGDAVVGMEVVQDEEARILTITVNGYGKRTPIGDYPVRNRGGKGVITIKTTPRNGSVLAVRQVVASEDVLLITNGGTIIRTPTPQIREMSRNTQGVKLINLGEGERLVAAALVVEDDEDEPVGELRAPLPVEPSEVEEEGADEEEVIEDEGAEDEASEEE